MVWTESEPGVWLDDFDGAEKVFYGMSQAFKMAGVEHGSVYIVCKISQKDSSGDKTLETLLRNAWKALRYEFPNLSVVAEHSKKKYPAAHPRCVEEWATETFYVNTISSAADLVPTLHLMKLPCLIFLPQASEVIFHSSHWRIDALGACMMMNRLFDLVSQSTADSVPRWDLEYKNLTPSLEDAVAAPKTSSSAMEATAEKIRKRNFESSYPSAGLPYHGDMTRQPTLSRPYAMELTELATQSLISACKVHGISITAAIHTACSEAVFDLSRHNDHNYSTVVSVNMRDQLPGTYNARAYACASYVTGITHIVRRADSFATRSAQLTKAYKGDWEAMEYMAALRPIYRVHGEALQAMSKPGARAPASNVTVSSLGLIEKYLRQDHGGIMVDQFRIGSAIMTRQPTLYIWTFQGRLTMSLDSNEAFYSVEAVAALLQSIRLCLNRQLNLTLDTYGEAGLSLEILR